MDSPEKNPLPKMVRDIKKKGFFTTKGSCFIEFVRPDSDAVLQVRQNEFNELSSCKTRGE